MWDGLHDSYEDLTWLVEGMRAGSLIFVTDGSYGRNRAPTVSGTGCIIHCKVTKKLLKGSFYFYKMSSSAIAHIGQNDRAYVPCICSHWQ